MRTINPDHVPQYMFPQAVFLVLAILVAACSDEPSPADAGNTPDVTAPPDTSPGKDLADSGGPTPDASAGAVVKTASGPVRGTVHAASRAFLGVPYAAPPVGPLRFAAPAAHKGWTAPKNATAFGHACPQVKSSMADAVPAGKIGAFTQSEDCLTLNVWTPWPARAKPAPVLVWIHGGGFTSGASSLAHIAPPGRAMAEKAKVVVVSINYRLGPLGFLAHPALGKASGNYGVQDQQAALAWIKANIAAFGGDPQMVTIAGESAGAFSVCVHLVSAGSKGLFHRAVMQSGACPQALPQNSTVSTQKAAMDQGKTVAQKVGCGAAADVAGCLRKAGLQKLLSALPLVEDFTDSTTKGASWGPNTDGVTLTKQPLDLVRAKTFHKVPVLLGTNKNEGSVLVVAAKKKALTQGQYIQLVGKMFSVISGMVLLNYPAVSYASPAAAMADLMGDLVFVCPARRTARALAAGGIKTYLYSFTVQPSYSASDKFLGAYHTAEVPFAFATPPPSLSFDTKEAALAAAMLGYWTRFARLGDPNVAGEVVWPTFAKATDQHMVFGLAGAGTGKGLKKKQCDFWDTLMP